MALEAENKDRGFRKGRGWGVLRTPCQELASAQPWASHGASGSIAVLRCRYGLIPTGAVRSPFCHSGSEQVQGDR